MTEAEFLASDDPRAMLAHLLGIPGAAPARPSDRKLRLFAVACMRLAGVPAARADEAERDGPPLLDEDESDGRMTDAQFAYKWTERGSGRPTAAAKAALLRDIVGDPFAPVTLPPGPSRECWSCQGYGNHLGAGPDCGNPECGECKGTGKLHAPCPWLTPDVLALAAAAYEERPGRECEACKGKGGSWRCPKCRGEWGGDVGPDCFVCGYYALDRLDCLACSGKGCVEDGSLDPERLLVLSDALEEAGAPDGALLRHLRGQETCPKCQGTGRGGDNYPDWQNGGRKVYCNRCGSTGWIPLRGPHVRGCWGLDVVLGYS